MTPDAPNINGVNSRDSGKIPFPTPGEQVLAGTPSDAVGYDDKLSIKNSNLGGPETKGALLIRNSWGKDWGDIFT